MQVPISINNKQLSPAQVVYLKKMLLGLITHNSEEIIAAQPHEDLSFQRAYRKLAFALLRAMDAEISNSDPDLVRQGAWPDEVDVKLGRHLIGSNFGAVIRLAVTMLPLRYHNKAAKDIPEQEIRDLKQMVAKTKTTLNQHVKS